MGKKNKGKLFIILAVAMILGLAIYKGVFASKIYDNHMDTGLNYLTNEKYEEATDILKEAQNLDIANEKLLMEILEVLTYIDGDLAYEFLDTSVEAAEKSNISPKIQEIINSSNEPPLNPAVNIEPGKYVDSLQLKMLDDIMDGSIPDKSSFKYNGKMDISESTNIKIIRYNKNGDRKRY